MSSSHNEARAERRAPPCSVRLLYIGADLRAQIATMSLLAQLFRHKDARTGEECAVVSLGAVAAAVEWNAEQGSNASAVAVAAASANLPPVGPGGTGRSAPVSVGDPTQRAAPPPRVSDAIEEPPPKVFATPEEVAAHLAEIAAQPSPAVLPEPSATEVLAALEFGISDAPVMGAVPPREPEVAVIAVVQPPIASEPPPPPPVIPSGPAIEIAVAETIEGRPLEVLAAWESPAPQESAVAAASHSVLQENAAAAEQSPVRDHESQAPSRESARAEQIESAAEAAHAAPVILAPRVMHLPSGAPPPVFLVPAGFLPPVQIERDEPGNAAANENAHADH